MLLKYIGHACFYIETADGTRIVIDPYDNSIGLAPVNEMADLALISHDHFDHSYTDGIKGDYSVFDAPGEYTFRNLAVTGFSLSHDDADGAKRGSVTAFLVQADGMRLLHMGDVGSIPDDDFFLRIGKIDVLMVPIGGVYTINATQALELINKINPNIAIPMHYKSSKLKLDIEGTHSFEAAAKKNCGMDVAHLADETLEISQGSLKKRGRILFMENTY